jgi:hypothetical protein
MADPTPQFGGITQQGEAVAGRLVVLLANGQIQDIGLASKVFVSGLPTSDPSVAGQLWLNSNVLTRSNG